ncbi:hypothetical protein [Burkholderia sp. lig30]|uniref:hypothetical protein n=1 Tax=Burkholderia sp. lig30 TaxID=1192124 RepID=UPI0005727D77|nr:hypothetical protein [Burkholderia sp. lig30]
MKKIVLAAVIGISLTSPLAHAAAKDGATTKSSSKSQAPNTAEFDKSLAQLREQMTTMHAQMDQIGKTQDPQERQRLLQQHWETMQSAMGTMRGMWGPGMMGYGGMGPGMMGPGMMGRGGAGMMGGAGPGGGGWGHMGGYYSQLTPEQLRKRQYMSDQYLQMQQEMMNNMMWQQQYRMGPPVVAPEPGKK